MMNWMPGVNKTMDVEHILRDTITNIIYTKMTFTVFGIGQGGYNGP